MHAIPRTWILQTAAIGLLTLFLALAKPCQGRAVVHPRYAAARVEEVLGSVGAESAMKKITWYTPSAAWFDVVGEGSGFGTLVTSRRPLKVTVLMLDTQKKQVMEVPGTAKGTASFPQYIDKQNPGDFKEFKAEQARHQVHTSQEHAGPLKSIGTVEYLGLRCRILRRVYSGERGNHWEIEWVARPLIPGPTNGDGSLTLLDEDHNADGTMFVDQVTSLRLYHKTPADWSAIPKGYKVVKVSADGAGMPGVAVPPGPPSAR